jgi:hypothetical protein
MPLVGESINERPGHPRDLEAEHHKRCIVAPMQRACQRRSADFSL